MPRPTESSLSQRPERRADVFCEQLRLFPGGEVAAPVVLVVVDEVGVRLLGPAPRNPVELVGEGAHADRDRDALGGEETTLVLPVEASRGDPRVGQPVERDVVEDVVAREVARLLQTSLEDLLNQAGLTGPVAVVERERREIDR